MSSISRRHFLTALAAASALPIIGCSASRKQTQFTSSATDIQGRHWMVGLDQHLDITFKLQLPHRGHAVIYSKRWDQAIAFGRRPGLFMQVIDASTGNEYLRINNAPDRRFYGHGIFNADHSLLFVSENHFGQATGVIGIYDPANGYKKIDEWNAGGTGTHEIRLSADAKHLVVANGGIHTHPDHPREKLNIDSMKPNLAFVELASGKISHRYELPDHQASVRHICVGTEGVAVGLQHQTHSHEHQSVTAWQADDQFQLMPGSSELAPELKHYIASTAIAENGILAFTAPKGHRVLLLNPENGELVQQIQLRDPGGICFHSESKQFVVSTGSGAFYWLNSKTGAIEGGKEFEGLKWDNHLMQAS